MNPRPKVTNRTLPSDPSKNELENIPRRTVVDHKANNIVVENLSYPGTRRARQCRNRSGNDQKLSTTSHVSSPSLLPLLKWYHVQHQGLIHILLEDRQLARAIPVINRCTL